MRKCQQCQVEVQGRWSYCPLCQTPLNTQNDLKPSSFPDVPLKYDKQHIARWLVLLSFLIIFVTLGLGLMWQGRIQWLQAALFGVVTMWLVVLIIIRKRRNLAKSLLYLLVILSLLCLYLDYLIGWTGWSTTYAVPLICIATFIGMFVSSWLMRMQTADYILYLTTAALLGLVPVLFLMLDWVITPIPAWITIALNSILLMLIVILKGPEIWRELKKRTFI